jgi:type VI protein secretion system component VasF
MVFHLDQKVDRYREELAAQIEALDQKLTAQIRALDQKVDRYREELTAQIQALDQKLTRYFIWLVGLNFAVLLAVIAALLGR